MTKTSIALWALVILAVIVTAFLAANRPRRVIIDAALPGGFPQAGFTHETFEQLLQDYVTPDGRVDYKGWHSNSNSVAQLDSYLAAVSAFSPDSAPERFAKRNDELAYWMYGYNAYVIKSVLDNWPLSSVTDVKAPIEAIRGLGFFYQLRFSFGGEYLSLYAVETDNIRKKYKDARIHFVLNCASDSCPIARPELPTGDDLDILMDQAAHDFINNPANVSVNHDDQIVYLSTIFKWYEVDFIQDLRRAGKPVGNGLIAYVTQQATDELARDLAKAVDYNIEFRDYDWALNSKG